MFVRLLISCISSRQSSKCLFLSISLLPDPCRCSRRPNPVLEWSLIAVTHSQWEANFSREKFGSHSSLTFQIFPVLVLFMKSISFLHSQSVIILHTYQNEPTLQTILPDFNCCADHIADSSSSCLKSPNHLYFYVIKVRLPKNNSIGIVLVIQIMTFFFLEPTSLLAGDVAMAQQAGLGRNSSTGKGRIFTGTSTRMEQQGSTPSTMGPSDVTSTPIVR